MINDNFCMTKILAIGAHPDDIEFGCAPLLIKEVKKGNQVKIVVASLGEAGTSGTPKARKKEAENAAKIIGAEIKFINLGGDSHIEYKPQNAFKIAEILRKYKPDIVLAPSLAENQHPDHLNLAKLTRDASRFSRYGGLRELKQFKPHKISALYYYGSSAEWDKKPDILIDVTENEALWKKTMESHKSQMKTKHYSQIILSKAAALGASMGVKLAIGLFSNDPIRLNYLSDITLSSRNY